MSETMYPSSVKDAVERWDRDETVWSVEMGGLGPGYEQAIQIAMMEILRAVSKLPELPAWEEYRKVADKALHEADDALGGLSGAMAGAATQLAWQFAKRGWLSVHDEIVKDDADRWIQIQKKSPVSP